MSPEVGDFVCKLLIASGGLLLVACLAVWLVSIMIGEEPRRDIPLRWRREDDRLVPDDRDGSG